MIPTDPCTGRISIMRCQLQDRSSCVGGRCGVKRTVDDIQKLSEVICKTDHLNCSSKLIFGRI